MSLNLLAMERFKIIAECENMTTAARRLFISQPTLSKMLNSLEGEIGYPCFDREKSRIKLNENGKVVLKYFNEMISLRNKMLLELDELNYESVSITRIGFDSVSFSNLIANYILNNVQDAKISVEVDMPDRLIQKALNDELDIIFVAGKVSSKDLWGIFFAKEILGVSIPNSNPLSSKKRIDAIDLKGQPFIKANAFPGDQFVRHKIIDAIMDSAGVKLNIVQNIALTTMHAAVNSNFLFLSSNLYKSNDIPQTNRTVVPFSDPRAVQEIYMYYKRNTSNKYVNVLITDYQKIFRY